MSKILIINASARTEKSVSRQLTSVFEKKWRENFPHDNIKYRNVGQDQIPHVDEKWIAAAFTPAEFRREEDHIALQISNKLIAELKEADHIVIGTPMYNWSVPSSLKAYIDQVLRVNETVTVNKETPKNPYRGLLNDKKVYLLMVRGNAGYEPGEFFAHMDFQTEYLKTVFGIMGVTDIEHFAVNGMDVGENMLELADSKIDSMIKNNLRNEVACS